MTKRFLRVHRLISQLLLPHSTRRQTISLVGITEFKFFNFFVPSSIVENDGLVVPYRTGSERDDANTGEDRRELPSFHNGGGDFDATFSAPAPLVTAESSQEPPPAAACEQVGAVGLAPAAENAIPEEVYRWTLDKPVEFLFRDHETLFPPPPFDLSAPSAFSSPADPPTDQIIGAYSEVHLLHTFISSSIAENDGLDVPSRTESEQNDANTGEEWSYANLRWAMLRDGDLGEDISYLFDRRAPDSPGQPELPPAVPYSPLWPSLFDSTS